MMLPFCFYKKADYKDVLLNLAAKTMLLKIYFLQEEHRLLDSQPFGHAPVCETQKSDRLPQRELPEHYPDYPKK